ncbi:Uu.00g036420.m01.CDS01 [Anthostomella pinea]|uniref:Uu.00g036420.m01.CDS01 n=1 Tax=Anthostomella pinea TaxID=933095 RepID=A0AAI8YB55_9PEZI|nr:Uu.00g036420.m01.CDS01 [Anthostomella pinea]
MRFQSPQLGALGVTFTALRAMQLVSLVAVIGLSANFINEMVTSEREAPDVLIGTLAVASITTLYSAISYILYYDGLLPLLVAGGMDLSFLIAAIVVAVTIGKPLSMLKCEILPEPASSTQTFTMSISPRDSAAVKYNSYLALITTDQPHCYEIKAVWGLAIALCVLYAFSALGCAGVRAEATIEKVPGSFGETHHISGPTALGTRLLSTQSRGPGSRFSPPLKAPEVSHRRAVLRSIDEDIRAVPTPPTMINAHAGPSIMMRRRPVEPILRPAPAIVHPAVAMPPMPFGPPTEDFIPVVHKRVPEPIQTNIHDISRTPIIMPPIPPTPSNDGFTPVTPAPSPRLKGFRSNRTSHLSQDALGISVVRFKSVKAQIVDDEHDDMTPLSPAKNRDIEAQVLPKMKPKRKTLLGVLEGWWDLGLLERGRSLRRRG